MRRTALEPAEGGGLEVRLDPMRRRHLRSVLRIESLVYPRPWSLSLFLSELALRSTRSYTVAKVLGTVVGYSGLMLTSDEGHITTIAVDPAWHRHQIGTRLMLDMMRVARGRGAREVTLEVRVSNHPAQAMYRRFGFAPEGIRPNYYVETQEDALVMWAHDVWTEGYAARLEEIESRIVGSTVASERRW